MGFRQLEQDHGLASMDMAVGDDGVTGATLPTIAKCLADFSHSMMKTHNRFEAEQRQLRQEVADSRSDKIQIQQKLTETQKRLSGTQNQVISLQDLRVHLTEDDAGKYFEEMVGLQEVARFPETEEDVIHACILNWITQVIFHKGLRGVSAPAVELIEGQAQALEQDNLPLYALRSWKAQAYYAWTMTPEYQSKRKDYVHILSSQLETDMRIFLKFHENPQPAAESLRNTIVEPALSLKEKMMSSRESFTVGVEHYTALPETQGGEALQLDFAWSECEDITDYHRDVKSDHVRQDPSKRLIALYAISPGLVMRKLESDSTFSPPRIITKQNLLVAWKKDPVEILRDNERKATFFTEFCRVHKHP
ncbi:hypothetical protein PG993_009825 [Apiospora rasikravindrae]|uniref:Uncharacterized protein n=1 Tax=Apiospora rasikravindrae TaxID=990691 RepID=A0ABR1SKG4_9PEZI